MDLFGEKKYEDLDLLTKMIEPVTWSALDVLANMPNEVVVPHEDILASVRLSRNIEFNNLWESLVLAKTPLGNFKERDFLRSRFELVADPDIIVNLEDNTVTGGNIRIVKTGGEVTEEELTKQLKEAGWRDSYNLMFNGNDETIERLREILDLFGTEVANNALKKRNISQLSNGIYSAFKDVMRNNRWNIRSVDLAHKVCRWMQVYIKDGNLAAMRNFCLLKAATHRGYPIYEIDEEQL